MTTDTQIFVTINSDPATLSDQATEADVAVFADNLAAHLTERFGRQVQVRPVQTLRLADCDDSEVRDYVRELFAGDGWTQFVS